MNKEYIKAAMEMVREHLETLPEFHELYEQRDKVIAELEGKVSEESERWITYVLSNASFTIGSWMFEWGFKLGQNPGALIELPEESTKL